MPGGMNVCLIAKHIKWAFTVCTKSMSFTTTRISSSQSLVVFPSDTWDLLNNRSTDRKINNVFCIPKWCVGFFFCTNIFWALYSRSQETNINQILPVSISGFHQHSQGDLWEDPGGSVWYQQWGETCCSLFFPLPPSLLIVLFSPPFPPQCFFPTVCVVCHAPSLL